jgi:lipopolysaccharide/colanic/teichoic acid biosynthesis glycosyltransferase
MAVIAVAIRVTMGRPVLFRQRRPGLHGRPFQLVKFRTMREPSAADVAVSLDVRRVTPLGRLLRQSSLDELPELWNILRGQMSLVGPRPLLVEYLGLYDATQARRHDVRPGLTGLAQVSGRRLLDMDQRLALDVQYVDSWSLRLDLGIMAQTVRMIASRTGVNPPPEVGERDQRWHDAIRAPRLDHE